MLPNCTFDVVSLVSYLQSLAQSNPGARLSQVKSAFCEHFGLIDVEFQDADGKRVPENTQVLNAVPRACFVRLTIPCTAPHIVTAVVERADSPGESAVPGPRPQAPEGTPLAGSSPENEHLEIFVRQFDQRERSSGQMWAKYVVNTLLPDIGLAPIEGKRFLRRLEAEGLIRTTKVPSRDNPAFSATRFHLNREHPRVQAILEGGRQTGPRIRPLIKLPPGSELVSETLIRERR